MPNLPTPSSYTPEMKIGEGSQFFTTRHYVKSQNTIISFEDINFWPEIFPFLHPFPENSTTYITMVDPHSAHLAPTPLK